MSLELTEEKMRQLAGMGGSGGKVGGRSPHELAASQLLYTKITVQKRDSKTGAALFDDAGEPIMEERLEVAGRTELPNPSGTTALVAYAKYCAANFRGNGANLKDVNDDYMVFMVSKDRGGRKEFTQIATGSALAQSGTTSGFDVAKEASQQ